MSETHTPKLALLMGATVTRSLADAFDGRISALETSLAEAQKERDNLLSHINHWKVSVVALAAMDIGRLQHDAIAARSQLTQLAWLMEKALAGATSDWGAALLKARNRATAAEQQLAEVKAQLDAQAGVIRELAEALEKIIAWEAWSDRNWGQPSPRVQAEAVTKFQERWPREDPNELTAETIAAVALDHVREPETK